MGKAEHPTGSNAGGAVKGGGKFRPSRRRALLAIAAGGMALALTLIFIILSEHGHRETVLAIKPSPSPSSLSAPASGGSVAGVLAGSTRKRVGPRTIRTSGVFLEGLDIMGDLVIDAPASHVTVVNVAVAGAIVINGDTPTATVSGKKVGIVPHDVVLRNVDAHRLEAVGFNGLSVENSRFHNNAGTISQLARYDTNGVAWPATNLRITGSVFEGLLPLPGDSQAHVEALHLLGVEGFVLTDDVFDATAPDQATWNHITAALTLESQFEGVSNSGTITGCHFLGGSYYQAYLWGATAVNDNAFVTSISPDHSHRSSPIYPPAAYAPAVFPHFTQQGNTLDGSPYTLPED